MNKSFIIIFAILFLLSCGQKKENVPLVEQKIEQDNVQETKTENFSENPRVFITYNQPVNGYKVEVMWFPRGGYSEIGIGIIKFTHISENNYFEIVNELFSDYYLDSLVRNHSHVFYDGESFTSDYIPPTKDELGHNTPFQFLDVDFDGEEELLINKRRGHRDWNLYDVYKVGDFYIKKLTRKPFDYLEDGNKFDFENKTITQFWSSGWNNFTKLVYRYQKEEINYPTREEEIFDDFYYPIKLDSLFICDDGKMSVYVNKKNNLVLVDSYMAE